MHFFKYKKLLIPEEAVKPAATFNTAIKLNLSLSFDLTHKFTLLCYSKILKILATHPGSFNHLDATNYNCPEYQQLSEKTRRPTSGCGVICQSICKHLTRIQRRRAICTNPVGPKVTVRILSDVYFPTETLAVSKHSQNFSKF